MTFSLCCTVSEFQVEKPGSVKLRNKNHEKKSEKKLRICAVYSETRLIVHKYRYDFIEVMKCFKIHLFCYHSRPQFSQQVISICLLAETNIII